MLETHIWALPWVSLLANCKNSHPLTNFKRRWGCFLLCFYYFAQLWKWISCGPKRTWQTGHSCASGLLCVFMWLIKVAFRFNTFMQMLHTNFRWKCTLFLCSESPPVDVKEASQYSHSKILDWVRSFSPALVLEVTPVVSACVAGLAPRVIATDTEGVWFWGNGFNCVHVLGKESGEWPAEVWCPCCGSSGASTLVQAGPVNTQASAVTFLGEQSFTYPSTWESEVNRVEQQSTAYPNTWESDVNSQAAVSYLSKYTTIRC